jgi:hypothetical protein
MTKKKKKKGILLNIFEENKKKICIFKWPDLVQYELAADIYEWYGGLSTKSVIIRNFLIFRTLPDR